MKILLIAGGWSSEREVSLSAAPALMDGFRELGHEVDLLDPSLAMDRLLEEARSHDFAFINLHGSPGEDGLVQALLDRAGCPYQGAGPAGSFLALNKLAAKLVFRDAGLPTADWEFLPAAPGPGWEPRLPYPLFVKSCLGGSSLHLGRAADRAELDALLADVLATGQGALLEPALQGRDVTCAVLGGEALPPILILPQKGDYFDFESKYADGGARELCPAPLPEPVLSRMRELALRAVEALGLGGYGRADFILGDDGSLTLLEVNTIPGMTSASLVPKAALAQGLSFPALLARLVELGLERAGAR